MNRHHQRPHFRPGLLVVLAWVGACTAKSPVRGSEGGPPNSDLSPSCHQAQVDDTGPWCSRTGALSCRGPDIVCPPYQSAPVTIGIVTTAYEGNLVPCHPLPDPTTGRGFSIAVTVESVQTKVFPVNGTQQLETWVHVDRTDVTPNCGLMVNFRSLTERPRLQPGVNLRIASRTVQRTDSDIPGINAGSTDRGQLLYAIVLSATPAPGVARQSRATGTQINPLGGATRSASTFARRIRVFASCRCDRPADAGC